MSSSERNSTPWLWIGGAILAAGVLILGGFLVYTIISADDIPLLLKAALLAVTVGLAILLAVVVRDRIIQKEQEDFTDIDD